MKLILKENVPNLGEAGEIITVKPGYGRNYLVPHGLAYEASAANMKRLEEEQKLRAEKSRRDKLEAGRRAAQLSGQVLVFKARASEEGKLFGSVTAADIADRLNTDAGLDYELDKKLVQLDEAIKAVGQSNVAIRFHADVETEIEVRVEPEEG